MYLNITKIYSFAYLSYNSVCLLLSLSLYLSLSLFFWWTCVNAWTIHVDHHYIRSQRYNTHQCLNDKNLLEINTRKGQFKVVAKSHVWFVSKLRITYIMQAVHSESTKVRNPKRRTCFLFKRVVRVFYSDKNSFLNNSQQQKYLITKYTITVVTPTSLHTNRPQFQCITYVTSQLFTF